jgi:hypothetical protein
MWCDMLNEVGWHLQEIMREGLQIYEEEGIRHFIENQHIHRNYFNNESNWREPSPYDNLLSTQHSEMLLMWADMKRKYRRLEDNSAEVKSKQTELNHTIAEFLQSHMPSSTNITTSRARRHANAATTAQQSAHVPSSGKLGNAQTSENIAGLMQRIQRL